MPKGYFGTFSLSAFAFNYFEIWHFAEYYLRHSIVIFIILLILAVKTRLFAFRIKSAQVGKNLVMKFPSEKKYGSNTDEKETFLPKQYDLENRQDNQNVKK